jgi:hypothetical protein
MNLSSPIKNVVLAAAFAASSMAMAASGDFVVDAFGNSTTGGTGVATFNLIAGQQFSVSVGLNDLWNAGDLPRWSNADGLNGNLTYANGMDSQVPVYASGTQIGQTFVDWSQNGLTAAYGSLVGQIDNGVFFKIGTSYTGSASATGLLKLYYFDENAYDNSGSISAQITAVSEPEPYAMVLAGLFLMGGIVRRRKVK